MKNVFEKTISLAVVVKLLLTMVLVWTDAQGACAQKDNVDRMVARYTDSLTVARAKIDTMTVSDDALSGFDRYRLFSSGTFFKDVAARRFSFADATTGTDGAIDDAMLHNYLYSPQLVERSETELAEAGAPRQVITTPMESHTAITEQVPEAPVDVVAPPEPEVVVEKPNFWTYKGDYALQFMQNYISGNWYKGGESYYSALGSVVMEANYNNKQKVTWDNKLELKVGFLTSRSDSVHEFKTSEDLIRLTSKLGLQATKNWYYTLQLIAYTQFTRGYKSNDETVYSDFFSPFNLSLALGMSYKVSWFKKRLTGTVQLAPLAYNFRYVGRVALATRYGLNEGRHTLHDFGSSLTADLVWQFSDNIKWATRLYGFTSYKRAEIEWENTFTFQFNKFIAANLFVYPRFDDSTDDKDHKMGYWQLKEYLSLGFSYSF